MVSKTLSPENQAKIACPVFKTETKIAACFALRDMFYRGERPTVRVGCQCAIEASKCPIPEIIKKMIRDKDDPYHSADPKTLQIDDWILDKIAPVSVPESMMNRYALSPQERKLLDQANDDARNGVRVIRKAPRREERVLEMDDVKAAPAPAKTVDASVAAATSGDMSAAINAGGQT